MEGLSESLEDYLEAILELQRKHNVARVKDIAGKLGVISGTVTTALRTLADRGLINYKPYSFITLTPKRHTVIKDFLQCVLLLEEHKAEENACRMEHAMDKIAINRLVQFIDYVYKCPRAGEDWISNFNSYFTQNKIAEAQCPECLETCLKRYRDKCDE